MNAYRALGFACALLLSSAILTSILALTRHMPLQHALLIAVPGVSIASGSGLALRRWLA